MNDSPPSYDQAAKGKEESQRDVKQPQEPSVQTPSMQTPANYTVAGPNRIPNGLEPIVYHYTNPLTGDHVASLLPPDHPEMVCLQEGKHIPKSSFGILGVLSAVLWFPLGVGICLLDRRVKCTRCGHIISESFCGPQ
ncbi:hypothetical protein E1B28_010073 [Marasmius oreades]|uniref:Brain protein I3 n=1 Tax=Marasmius oreades TaxID=181124 RepID=A0A9P7URE6_9AGAR|nr:uncharacterized protein E1B28_010073 [Marasmius oreades]KAG7091010.1 hypothetical protein E1B28_010073 [Marasmius oreades]